MKWIARAAERGFLLAQQDLAGMYHNGSGVERNYGEAEKWLRKAAEQDSPLAQNALAAMYASGIGVPQNFMESRTWYLKSALHGEVAVPAMSIEERELYLKTALPGIAEARGRLGLIYAEGIGVEPDLVEAYTWFNLAVAGGATNFVKFRDQIMMRLSPQQLAEGQSRAASFVSRRSRIVKDNTGLSPR